MLDDVRRTSAFPRRAYERCVALAASSEVSKSELGYVYLRPEQPRDLGGTEELLADHLGAMALAAALAVVAGGVSPDREGAHEASGDPEQAFERAELWDRVRSALEQLGPEAQAIVRRHYLEGESLGDIARDLAVSKSWVSRILTRTMARLSRRLRALA
jgi:RNA polymerase sigma factor (sigma-70 family)